jgi:hypothetical protein
MCDDSLWLLFLVTVVSRKLIAMTLRIGDKGPLALPLHTNLLRFPLWVVHEFEQQHCASRRSCRVDRGKMCGIMVVMMAWLK